jgi:hypothetical protein
MKKDNLQTKSMAISRQVSPGLPELWWMNQKWLELK